MILISQLHNDDRLGGTLANLNRGTGNAKIRIYDDSGTPQRPAAITDAATGVLLAVFTLNKPVGSIVNHQLVLSAIADALVLADGTAKWARISDGDDAPSMDCDVTNNAGSGEIKLTTTALLAGGATRLVSGVFT